MHFIVFYFTLFYRLCTMFLPELGSFVAAMLFAVHPIHTEAVSFDFLSFLLVIRGLRDVI